MAREDLLRSKISLLWDQGKTESVAGLLQGAIVSNATVPANLVKSVDEFANAFPNSTAAQKIIPFQSFVYLQFHIMP